MVLDPNAEVKSGRSEMKTPNWRLPIRSEEAIAAILIFILFAITLGNVVSRYILHSSFAFTEEYSGFLLSILVFVTTSWAVANGGHLRMTFLLDRVRPSYARSWEIIGCLAVIGCFAVMIYYGLIMVYDAYRYGETSPAIGHPMWLYLMWVPIVSALVVYRSCTRIYDLFPRADKVT